ncbi:hypothetical protein O0I10_011015 [Lichtheimia ornata]|uniref:Major facilitator superfamily (MFS) profile domain-containing protein n=1 Tax=Lichtheimia ornata TaxID=688661 RepID=A0AAD7UTM6_9FUNG|nr:uncharacterized protein O0I10_011015 [Lichtheimia ornata]KAJ8653364.1 hypothetical protein O0I10_011015 [Lichtheimia ornata]
MSLSDRTPLLEGHSQENSNEVEEEEDPVTLATGEYDAQLEKRLVRKYDLMLLPFLSLMYLFSSLDRSSLGNAVLDNFEEDVGITPDQFNTSITIFYVGFLLFQIPSNIMLKKFTARRWLPLLMIAWGTMACLHATINGFASLVILRFLLGVFESGFFPGVIFFLTLFYKKNEIATRIALFWGSTVAAHAYAGILAYGILRLRGAQSMAGWQWLFLIEGIPTVLVAIIAWFYLPSSPETWSRLTLEEQRLAVSRLAIEDGGQHHHHVSLRDLDDASNREQAIKALVDWKVWLWMVMFFSGSVANTSISNFLPLIVKGMGYNDKLSANLMSSPPYLGAVIVMIGMAYSSDKFQERTYHAIAGATFCLIGYVILTTLTARSALYAGICIVVAGVHTINPIMNAWLTSNIAPEMKRSVAAAMAVSANNSAGLLGSNIYRQSDAPRYLFGHTISLVFLCVFIVLALIQRWLLLRVNQIKTIKIKQNEPNQEGTLVGDEALDFMYRV